MTRPASFDARVMSYHRLLWKFAKRHYTEEERQEELVQSTILRALDKWENYREDGSFTNWLRYLMLQLVGQEAEKRTAIFVDVDEAFYLSTPATQESDANANSLLSLIAGSEIMNLLAIGHPQKEIAKMRGVSKQAISRHVVQERARLMKVAA